MAELQVALVSPEREVWSGTGREVLAKTQEGEVGILAGHISLLGALVDGGVVRVRRHEDEDVLAAVHGGFLSVHDDRVSILAENAELGTEVDVDRERRTLEEGSEEQAARARARLTAAGRGE